MIQNGCEPGCESCPFQVDVDTDGSNKFKIGTLVSPKVRVTRGSTYTFNSTTVMHTFRISKTIDGTHGSSAEEEGRQYTEGYDYDFETGLVTFTPGDEAPDVLYYYSGASANMGGIIEVVSEMETEIFSNMNDRNPIFGANYAISNAHSVSRVLN